MFKTGENCYIFAIVVYMTKNGQLSTANVMCTKPCAWKSYLIFDLTKFHSFHIAIEIFTEFRKIYFEWCPKYFNSANHSNMKMSKRNELVCQHARTLQTNPPTHLGASVTTDRELHDKLRNAELNFRTFRAHNLLALIIAWKDRIWRECDKRS